MIRIKLKIIITLRSFSNQQINPKLKLYCFKSRNLAETLILGWDC